KLLSELDNEDQKIAQKELKVFYVLENLNNLTKIPGSGVGLLLDMFPFRLLHIGVHCQCYFRYNSPIRFATLKAKLPRQSHIEIAKGSPYQNFEYCSKQTIIEEIGERPEPPNRKRKST
ncbi:MAG: hypothetical protein K0T53_04110, partial [Wolbachia pipientis]|nr:hypothetical protein [Wolbachia pipientis]